MTTSETDGEPAVVDNSPENGLAAEELELEKMARAMDAGEALKPPEPEPEPEPEVETEGEEKSSVSAEDDGSLITEGETPKPTREEKDAVRLDKTWRQVNDEKDRQKVEKDRLKSEREALDQERKELERQKAERVTEFKDSEGNTSDDYRKAAQNWHTEGEYERAKWAEQQAKKVEQQAQVAKQQAEQERFRDEFQRNFDQAAEEHPDLNTRTSELYQGVMQLMQDKPFLASYPEGVKDAVQVVRMRETSSRVKELETKLSGAEKEIEEYKGKLSIGGSPPADRPAGSKSFDDMNDSEREKALEELAGEFDRQGVSIFGR